MRMPRWTHGRQSLLGVLTVMLVTLAVAVPVIGPLPISADEATGTTPPKPLNIDIKGGDIAECFSMLGQAAGVDVTVGPGVQGTIPSMRLRDKTVEEALYLIAQTLGLQVFRADPTTYIVAPPGTEPQFPLVEPFRKPVGQPPSLRVAAGAESAPLRVKVALLGRPIDKLELTADHIRVDHHPADMYTFTGPSAETIRQILAAAEGIRIQPQEGVVQAGEEQSFEFIWPQGRPQYYLEEVEPDLYRRVELADKEGYIVRVRRSEGKSEMSLKLEQAIRFNYDEAKPGVNVQLRYAKGQPAVSVELEMARRTLSGGKYDEALRAFVGRPMLTKTVVTRTVPLTRDEATLVVWQGAPEPPVSAKPKRAPSWAVGEWEMTGPGEETGLLTVKSDGSVLWTSGTNRWQPADEPRMIFGPGTIDASGQVEIKVALGEEEVWKMTLHGRLNPDGTATGGVSPQGVAWTATKAQGPATEQGAPAWAVGEWDVSASDGGHNQLTVLPNGIFAFKGMPGIGTISPSGQLSYRRTEAEATTIFTGVLWPDGTGSGSGHGTHASGEEYSYTWTASKVPGPETQQGAPPWAVGEWSVETSRGKYFTIIVLPSGTVLGDEREKSDKRGRGTIDPSGQIEYRITYDPPRDIHFEGTITGTLTPERTGGGTIHQEGAAADSASNFGAFWTAGQILQPIPYTARPAPEPVRVVVPIPQAAPGPAGVAVLLEIGPPKQVAEIPEEIKALIEQPGPQIEIECKFVEIEKDPDKPLAMDWQDNPQQWLRDQLMADKAEIINAPTVSTRNGVPATVSFTSEIPYFSATITYDEFGKRSVDHQMETVFVGQSISVTPTLQANGQILMDIDFRVDGQVGTVVGPSGELFPIVTTQSGSTQARVADGETLVIGGITGGQGTLDRKMPLAHQGFPIIGRLFRSRLAAQPNEELLIFVTPKVIPGTAPVSLSDFGAITGEIRDGEQWVWDIVNLGYLDAADFVGLAGGYIYGEDNMPVTPSPPARPGPYHGYTYGEGKVPFSGPALQPPDGKVPFSGPALQLPEGMDPPIAIRAHNALLVHGTQEAINQFREILAFFDKPAKQVEIEAKFVEVKIEEGQPSGMGWFAIEGSLESFSVGFKPDDGIHVARFRRGRFESELKALLDEGRAEVVNAPRVTTRNNIPATVSFTSEIPYSYATTTYDEFGNRKVNYETDSVSVTQSLTVTPRILDDNSIVLDIEAEINRQVGTEIGPNGEVLPVVSTRSAYTRVRVADGDTIVIGGFSRITEVLDPKQALPPEETAHTEELERTEMRQTELLLFVTPRIIRESPRRTGHGCSGV